MKLFAALLASLFLFTMPQIANAGGSATCSDFTGDGVVSTMDILHVLDHYQEPKGDGGFYSIADILAVVQQYGQSC